MGAPLTGFDQETIRSAAGPSGLRDDRLRALDRFEAAMARGGLPNESLEDWRYSRIDELDLDRYLPASLDEVPSEEIPEAVKPLMEAVGETASFILTRDGTVGACRVSDQAVRVGGGMRGEDGTEKSGSQPRDPGGELDALATLNTAMAADPVTVDVAAGSIVRRPIVVVHWIAADAGSIFPRLLVNVQEGSVVRVVEVIASADVDSLVVPVTELSVGDGANLGYMHLQVAGPRVWQIGTQASVVGRDGVLDSSAVAVGGSYARMRTSSILAGRGGETRLKAVYFGSSSQMHDFRTVQDHRAPNTRSDLLYKGALANRSRSVYSGLIRVEKGAHGTNAFQTNRNLVLHEGAHADSVPNLEIEDNDVSCSHASAVGPIAEDQRFYLEARGVPTDVADKLITLGFLDDGLRRLPVSELVPHLRLVLAEALESAEKLEAASVETGSTANEAPDRPDDPRGEP